MAVSSLVPASSGITVADGNTAGWNNTSPSWTLINYTNPSSVSSITWSGLSGYKSYKVFCRGIVFNGTQGLGIRINGDSNGVYSHVGNEQPGGSLPSLTFSHDSNYWYIGVVGSNSTTTETTISNADQSTNFKKGITTSVFWDSSWRKLTAEQQYQGSGAITSITVYSTSGGNNLPQGNPYGFYLYGGN